MKRLLIPATITVAALSGCVALPYDEPYTAYPATPVYTQPYYAPVPVTPVYPAPVYVAPPVQFSFGFGYWGGHGGHHHHHGRGFGGHHFGGGGHGWRR